MDGIRSSHASRDNLGVVFAGGAEEIAFLTIPFLQENILRETERESLSLNINYKTHECYDSVCLSL